MTTVKKKPKLSLPPTPTTKQETAMKAMIEKGGAVAAKEDIADPQEDVLRSFSLRIYESELEALRTIARSIKGRKQTSIHDVIMEAVQQRIKRG